MLELAGDLLVRVRRRRAFVVATVVQVQGSAPRQIGASLVLDADGAVLGNVSGGCVDAAVHDAAQQMLIGDHGSRVMRFGYSDADAIGVGLTCGGTIELLLRHHDPDAEPDLEPALVAAGAGEAVAAVTIVRGPPTHLGRMLLVYPHRPSGGTLGDDVLDQAAQGAGRGALHAGQSRTLELLAPGSCGREPITLLVECATVAPRMLLFGAIDHAAALSRIGAFLGYRVSVCDARATFATAQRFPEADEVVVDWPHRYLQSQDLDGRTVICVLTHDPKFDLPLLDIALRLPVAYVGAMGSRRTHDERLVRLRAGGLSAVQLARLHSPIGLDLGARSPQEIALSIAAEIVALRHGGSGAPLRAGGDIHHPHPLDTTAQAVLGPRVSALAQEAR